MDAREAKNMRGTMKIVLTLIVLILAALTAVPDEAAVFNVLLDTGPVGRTSGCRMPSTQADSAMISRPT